MSREPMPVEPLVIARYPEQWIQSIFPGTAVEHIVIADGFGLRPPDDAIIDAIRRGQRQLTLKSGVKNDLDFANFLRPLPAEFNPRTIRAHPRRPMVDRLFRVEALAAHFQRNILLWQASGTRAGEVAEPAVHHVRSHRFAPDALILGWQVGQRTACLLRDFVPAALRLVTLGASKTGSGPGSRLWAKGE